LPAWAWACDSSLDSVFDAASEDDTHQHLHRELHTWVDDDGMVILRGRLTPEIGAVVQRELDAAADRLFRETADSSAPTSTPVVEEVTPAQLRADALGVLVHAAA
jgi:hypothetical protein